MFGTLHSLAGQGSARFIVILHQPFQVLREGGEGDLLVHFGEAPVAGSALSMGLFGFAEQVFDPVTQLAREVVAFAVGQFGGAVKAYSGV